MGTVRLEAWIRTNGTKRRRLVLYPAELRIRISFVLSIVAVFPAFGKCFLPLFSIGDKKLPDVRFAAASGFRALRRLKLLFQNTFTRCRALI